jgi:outer membrane protein assembly factor BamB
MRTLWTAALVGLALAAPLLAQDPRKTIYSRPTIPAPEVLRRLNLVVMWRAAVPMVGRRDGFQAIQLNRKDLFVITRSGVIYCYDAESGVMRWKARVGKPHQPGESLGFNTTTVFATSGTYLYALERANGSERWHYNLPGGLAAQPVADDDQLYFGTTTGNAYAFRLPKTIDESIANRPESARISAADSLFPVERDASPRPKPVWVEKTDLRLEYPPLQTPDVVFFFSPAGSAVAFLKFPREETRAGSNELYRFSTDKKVRQTPGQYDDTGFFGSEDANLYAIDLNHGKLRWRFTAGSPVSRRPASTEKDVFITSEREGLARLDRITGDATWRIPRNRRFLDANPDADRFLATNDKFVYATDRSGRLLVLDRKRGVTLSSLDTRAFHYPVVNEVTDRLYLAAQNGLIVCLRDRDQTAAIRHRKIEEQLADQIKRRLANLSMTTEAPGKPTPLRDILDDFSKKYNLKIRFSDAFKKADPKIGDKPIRIPKLDAKPLNETLQLILIQANASYEIADDTILIVPGRPKK